MEEEVDVEEEGEGEEGIAGSELRVLNDSLPQALEDQGHRLLKTASPRRTFHRKSNRACRQATPS